MIIPGYKVVKDYPDEDVGRITIISVKEGEIDSEVFSIDSEGIMNFSIDALKQARDKLEHYEP